ncbi:uncharacterized protein LOC143301377 [Babylonia areolata]|uniref:uncharacterized protein LOC143301377 n=1 Tax=Babylonia areolata TaxID=304850 RepID=UPI003FD623AE
MASVRIFTQLLFLAMVAILLSVEATPTFRDSKMTDRPKEPKVEAGERYSRWGPQNFLGWLPVRSRRREMENSISPFSAPPSTPAVSFPPRVSPEASALGESIMEEFVLFLTMKDAGLLDLCMQLK